MASLWDFCVRLSMDGFLLEASAYNVMHRIDGNEGGFVLFQGDILQLAHLKTGNNAVEHLFGIAGVGTLAVEEGNAAPQPVHEGIGNLLVFIGDNHDSIGLVQALYYDVNHLGDDEVCYQGVHGLVPAEDEACRPQDKEVEEHDNLADGEGGFLVNDDGDDFRAVQGTAVADDQPHAGAGEDAAEDSRQKVIAGDAGDGLKVNREHGDGYDGYHGRNGKGLAYLLVAHVEEGQVQQDHEHAEGSSGEMACHDGDTYHAAIDDVVGHQENFQSRGVNQGAQKEQKVFFYPVLGFFPLSEDGPEGFCCFLFKICHRIPPLSFSFLFII